MNKALSSAQSRCKRPLCELCTLEQDWQSYTHAPSCTRQGTCAHFNLVNSEHTAFALCISSSSDPIIEFPFTHLFRYRSHDEKVHREWKM